MTKSDLNLFQPERELISDFSNKDVASSRKGATGRSVTGMSVLMHLDKISSTIYSSLKRQCELKQRYDRAGHISMSAGTIPK